jgi:hypothetical protein
LATLPEVDPYASPQFSTGARMSQHAATSRGRVRWWLARGVALIGCSAVVGLLQLWWPFWCLGYFGSLILIHNWKHGDIEWKRFFYENWFWIVVAPLLVVGVSVLVLVFFVGGEEGSAPFTYALF